MHLGVYVAGSSSSDWRAAPWRTETPWGSHEIGRPCGGRRTALTMGLIFGIKRAPTEIHSCGMYACRMRRIVFLGFVLLLAGCAEHWQNVASGARSDIIACNNAKNNADSWGVFYYCDKANGVPLPPECLVSDDAARSPKCVAIAKGEAMTGAVTSTGQTAITAGTLFVH
jgi:hypothetical protein